MAYENFEVSFNPQGLKVCSLTECEYLISTRQQTPESALLTLDLLQNDIVAYDNQF
jgi:hypothetical protein